jgi:hypothetical protein
MLLKKIEQRIASAGTCSVIDCKKQLHANDLNRAAMKECYAEVDKALLSLQKSGRIEIVLGSYKGNPTRIILVKKSEQKKTTRKADTDFESDKGGFGIPGL